MADLKKWLAEGANPDDELNNAIVADDIDRVRYLLSHGAHVDAIDGEGHPALINATRFGFNSVAIFLVEHKASPNLPDKSGWTPLMYAAWGDDPGLAKMLLAHGAKLDSTDNEGLTPLAIAAQNAKVNAARALLDAGADVNTPVAKGGYTPLMLASMSGSTEVAPITDRSRRESECHERRRRDRADDRCRRQPFAHCRAAAQIGRRCQCAQRGRPYRTQHRAGQQQ